MTPASEIALSPARAHGARPSDRARVDGGRWERVFAVLGVCLPIPLLAVTGLSIPLPAGVERIGAALVAWADASVDGTDPLGLDRGSIVLASGERVLVQAPSGPEPDTARRAVVSLSPLAGTPGGANGGGTPPKDEGSDGGGSNGGNGGGSTPPDPGGGDPGDEPGLVEGTVKTVTEAPVVEEVDKTLDDLLPRGDDDSSGGVLEDALSGLGL